MTLFFIEPYTVGLMKHVKRKGKAIRGERKWKQARKKKGKSNERPRQMRAQGRNESRGRVCVRPGIGRERQKMNEWQQTERLEIKVQSSLWQWKTMRKNQETKIIHLTAGREAKPELPYSCSNNISTLTEIGIRVCHCGYFDWKNLVIFIWKRVV